AFDQDWHSVRPVARSFHPASVLLPLHQGWVVLGATPPSKFANAELMKIPNFFHLTPPTIERHCQAWKKFCTECCKSWISTKRLTPITITTSDYLNSFPSLSDAQARIVRLQV
ncbi:hypothetical protein DAPPUDRAFT_44321, partial [Daphnia pulex]